MAVVLMLLSPAIYSYATWMLRPSSMPFFARSVEWVRADLPFGNRLVDQIEHIYYSWNAPTKGGPQLKSLPPTGHGREGALGRRLPGLRGSSRSSGTGCRARGSGSPTGPPVKGGPPVLVTTFRPETDYPRNVAYLAWFDHTRTDLAFYPGRYEPPSAAVRGPAMVPENQRRRLLATFNSGFIYRDVNNGSTDNGRVNEPLAKGNATLDRLPRRQGRDQDLERRGKRGAGRRLVAPEPAADHLERTPQPQPERQHAVGLHGRQRGPRLAHRGRH